jgi:hypothetical protein
MTDPKITRLLEQIIKNQQNQQYPFNSSNTKLNLQSKKNTSHNTNHHKSQNTSVISNIINPNPFTCDLVIARYKENLNWLQKYSKYKFRNIYIYNKYHVDYNKTSSDLGCILNSKECIKINLNNEGRCDHTYLYHIIENYNNLADVTVFTKGSSDLYREVAKLDFTIAKVFELQDTVFSTDKISSPAHIQFANFSLDQYKSTHTINYNGDDDIETSQMKPSFIRPFGKWYQSYFPGIDIYDIVYAGVFALSKKLIYQHPKSYYQNLIKELEGHPNPEVGHYFERSWLAVFHIVPETCIYPSVVKTSHFGGGTRRKGKHFKRKRKIQRKKTRRYAK